MNEVVHTSPTIGSNVEEVVWKNVHFIMWDLGGQDSLRAAWNTYYSNTEVCRYSLFLLRCPNNIFSMQKCPMQFLIVVIDSTDRERLPLTKEEILKMLAHEVNSPFNKKNKKIMNRKE